MKETSDPAIFWLIIDIISLYPDNFVLVGRGFAREVILVY